MSAGDVATQKVEVAGEYFSDVFGGKKLAIFGGKWEREEVLDS
jgi:hypothetical protein